MALISKLFDKDRREVTNTWMAVAAVLLSAFTLAITQYQQLAGTREVFSISADGENNGPIEITEIQGKKCVEAYARIVITSQSQKRMSVSSIAVSMKNQGVITLSEPIIVPTRADGTKTENTEIPLVAMIEPVYSTSVKTSVPRRYETPIEVPFLLEPYEQKTVYVKVRSMLLESPKVIEALEELLKQNKNMTAGQFWLACIEKGYGRPVQIHIGGKTIEAVGGPDRATLEVRVKSSGGMLRTEYIPIP